MWQKCSIIKVPTLSNFRKKIALDLMNNSSLKKIRIMQKEEGQREGNIIQRYMC